MKRNDVFPSNYLKADDVSGNGEKYTVQDVTVEEFKNQEKGTNETKPVVWFKETDKGLILNKTNWDRIAEQHGDETKGWEGKKIKLRLEKIEAFGKTKDGIRVAV